MKKRVLITGGEGGVGSACRELFTSAGWDVLAPGRAELDVSCADSVEQYFSEAGEIDLLLCNAGVTDDCLLAKMSERQWDRALEVNLKGAFRCARAVSRQMLRRRSGQVIFVSSYSAFHPPAGQANYAAAKAGLVGLAKSLAAEWGSRGVRVNVVVPGFLETKMTESVADTAKEAALSKHVLGQFNEAEKVAKFVRFMEEEMPYTSGQVFNLDSRIL